MPTTDSHPAAHGRATAELPQGAVVQHDAVYSEMVEDPRFSELEPT